MHDTVLLAHGGGGLLSSQFVAEHILSRLTNQWLAPLDDAAVFESAAGRLAFTTDAYVVSPLFFPGANIGDLAVCGTVNDLAMMGAKPQWLSLSLILEEGLAFSDLHQVLDAVAARAREADVRIVCGDTKVVDQGNADGLFITTAGVGQVPAGVEISSHRARPGDAVLLSGVLGLHGLAVMLSRGNLDLTTPVESDVAPLGRIVAALLEAGIEIHALRDCTRGGLSMALHDIAAHSEVSITVEEERIPTTNAQMAVCDLLGLDPLHIACEGRFVALLPQTQADQALGIMRSFAAAQQAAIIGEARAHDRYPLELVTAIGSTRVITVPRGEQLPRIC